MNKRNMTATTKTNTNELLYNNSVFCFVFFLLFSLNKNITKLINFKISILPGAIRALICKFFVPFIFWFMLNFF